VKQNIKGGQAFLIIDEEQVTPEALLDFETNSTQQEYLSAKPIRLNISQ
jgi:hypothetical protein